MQPRKAVPFLAVCLGIGALLELLLSHQHTTVLLLTAIPIAVALFSAFFDPSGSPREHPGRNSARKK